MAFHSSPRLFEERRGIGGRKSLYGVLDAAVRGNPALAAIAALP
jgi:hypothetical protein